MYYDEVIFIVQCCMYYDEVIILHSDKICTKIQRPIFKNLDSLNAKNHLRMNLFRLN